MGQLFLRDNSSRTDNYFCGTSLLVRSRIFRVTEVYCNLLGLLYLGGVGSGGLKKWAQEGWPGGPVSPISAPRDPEIALFLPTFLDFEKTEVPGERYLMILKRGPKSAPFSTLQKQPFSTLFGESLLFPLGNLGKGSQKSAWNPSQDPENGRKTADFGLFSGNSG